MSSQVCYYLHCLILMFHPIFLIYLLLVLAKAIILMWYLKREVSGNLNTTWFYDLNFVQEFLAVHYSIICNDVMLYQPVSFISYPEYLDL